MQGSKGNYKVPTETLLELYRQGLSLRQIGRTVGVDHKQVANQLKKVKGVRIYNVVGRVEEPPKYGKCISYTLPLEDVWAKYGIPGENKTKSTRGLWLDLGKG